MAYMPFAILLLIKLYYQYIFQGLLLSLNLVKNSFLKVQCTVTSLTCVNVNQFMNILTITNKSPGGHDAHPSIAVNTLDAISQYI